MSAEELYSMGSGFKNGHDYQLGAQLSARHITRTYSKHNKVHINQVIIPEHI